MNLPLPQGTIGNKPHEIRLIDELNKLNDLKMARRVLCVYNLNRRETAAITKVFEGHDKFLRQRVLKLLTDEFKRQIKRKDLPEIIKDLLLNCVDTQYKVMKAAA